MAQVLETTVQKKAKPQPPSLASVSVPRLRAQQKSSLLLLVNICDNRRGEWACLLMGGRRAIYLVCKPRESLINVRADTISSSLLALGTHRDDERIFN